MTPAPPDDAPPGEGWRVYFAFAGSVAAATPFALPLYFLILTAEGRHQTLFGGGWDAFLNGLLLGPIVGVVLAGPPTVVYHLCRPPGHRLRTWRGWLTLCAGAATVPFGLLVGDSLALGWGGKLLPAMVAGLLTAAAAGQSEAVDGEA